MKKRLLNKDFVLMLQGSIVSTIGDLMYSVAIGYWVYNKTGSSALMGVMSAVSMLITMFLSPFSGSVVDKCNRKWILVGGDLLQGAIMLTVGTLAFMDRLSIYGVLIAAVLAAIGGVFYSPASNTLMIDIIPKDDMVRGQSIFSGALSLVNMVGSSFSGVLVAFFGVPLIVVINGLSNVYSALSELFVSVPKTVQQGEPVTVKGILHDTKTAVQTVFADPCLKLFVPFVLLLNLLASGPWQLMLPFTMEKGFSIEQYGLMLSIVTAASFVGVMVLGVFKLSPKVRFWLMALGFVLSEVLFILTYLSNNFVVMCVLIFVAASLNAVGNSVFNAALMLALPEENRGAILGFISSASVGGVALSSLIYGALGEIVPLYIVFAVGSILTILPMIFIFFHRTTKEFVLTH